MKKHILERYRRDGEGKLVVDIAASKVSDLYDDFDKHAPFVKKELDYDLVEYLIDSVTELGRESFGVCFTFGSPIDNGLELRVQKSIKNYFGYLLETNRREVMKTLRSSVILLSLGALMLAVSIYLNLRFDLDDAVVEGVMAEGLVIAAWVSVWEGLAGVLLNLPPLLRTRRVYHRLSSTDLQFQTEA
ncbi:hypothetical protein [Pontiella sulfatireligans]|uniref:Uncharacterized protein n=1 Tax=Pontiella sulfatireligans TaxID=2750658 RepID=A0A6C2UF17_9BACT|nr:hypothetical protein [Pontiella sulfatireligans]VGO18127.1 hypothetical protein SCARR_00178 [Pontiella sulfatireligans]